ncbi:MAG: glycerol kinase GlpK [Acidobacteria bacterium]|nr:glycerol kinase GlpK [Acidobacteriota bacterium]
MSKYVLALDQGTTSSRAILYDQEGIPRSSANLEFKQYYPQAGWVEHDPEEIWQSQRAAAEKVLADVRVRAADIAAIGITNQRETVLLWERATGKPVYPAIVWQCRRTAPMCDRLRQEGFDRVLRSKTGLITDAYFSGTKIAWLLDNLPGVRVRAQRGELAAGTIDTWLIWKLTGGRVHATDVSNASRTLLFNIKSLQWDEEILHHFNIPHALLPRVIESSGVLAETDILGGTIPLAGVAGDQQASLFGHQCFARGSAKNTYGTGLFLLMNAGEEVPSSTSGLVATIGWSLKGKTVYALEGSVFVAGAALQWLRDGLGLLKDAAASDAIARSVADAGGVYFVPALVGLGAPHWDPYARGTIVGITRGTTRSHVVRAALEAAAYQTREVLEAMARDSGIRPEALRVDGGMAHNNFLCQFQADILGIPVERPVDTESTALGAAYLAGLATGFWKDQQALAPQRKIARRFEPSMPESRREQLYADWLRAVERAKHWAG